MSACSAASREASAGRYSGSVFPAIGRTAHAFSPSKAWTPFMPWAVNSVRILFGRFIRRTNGEDGPGPNAIVPVMRMLVSALILSRPPRASTWRANTSSTVSALARRAPRDSLDMSITTGRTSRRPVFRMSRI
jgi:hypothetical protein